MASTGGTARGDRRRCRRDVGRLGGAPAPTPGWTWWSARPAASPPTACAGSRTTWAAPWPEAENLLAYPPSVFREKRGIDLRLHTRVTGIDTAARTVRLAGPGGSLAWDTLVVTSGADPVRPPVPGLDEPPRVHDPVPGRGHRAAAAAGQRHGPPGSRGGRRLHRPGDRGSAGLRGRGRGRGGGAARGAGDGGPTHRRAGPGRARTAHEAAARRAAGGGRPGQHPGRLPGRGGGGRGDPHRPGGHRGRASAPPPTC